MPSYAGKKNSDSERAEEYEMIPLTPLRRLEKRLEAIEQQKTAAGLERFIDKVIDMVELNQKIVEEVVRANQGLREDVAVLVGKMDELYMRLGDFIDIIKAAGEEEGEEAMSAKIIEESVKPLVSRIEAMGKVIQEGQATMQESLTSMERRLRAAAPSPAARAMAPPPMFRPAPSPVPSTAPPVRPEPTRPLKRAGQATA